jgi:nitrogen permease regulator 3-like protein
MFQEVVRWMLQRDLLVTLHLRVRIVVPASLKVRVRHRREELRENRWHTGVGDAFRPRRHRTRTDSGGSEGDFGLFDELPWYTRRAPGSQHNGSSVREVIEPPILEEGIELDEEIDEEEEKEEEESSDEVGVASLREEEEEEEEDDDNETSILADPGRATAAQRRWLQAMSEGKDELVTRRFDQFVIQHGYTGDLGLMVWFTELINTSMASARMMRYCFVRKYLGDSCVKFYTCMMNT